MKSKQRFTVISFVLLVAYVLSACAGAPAAATNVGGSKPLAQPVTYLGVIESISGDQWTINGLTVTVSSDIVRDGPFAVGDQIKVEAVVNADGSLSISRVEAPSVDDLSGLPQLGNDNDDNSNDDNANDANSNDDNANDANSNDDLNSNDDNSNDANSNDDLNSNDDNSNDDSNSNDDNSNDDNGNDSNSNDDDDDDNGNSTSNSNDDDDDDNGGSSGSNSNDDDDDDDDSDNDNDNG